jgi:hypothetical protein
MKNKKFKNKFLPLAGIIALVNLSFCLMPSMVSAEAQTVLMLADSANTYFSVASQAAEESCGEDSSHLAVAKAGPKKVVSGQTDGQNALLPCCQNDGQAIEADAPRNQNFVNLIFDAINIGAVSGDTRLSQNSLHISTENFPPPESEFLASVIKKE